MEEGSFSIHFPEPVRITYNSPQCQFSGVFQTSEMITLATEVLHRSTELKILIAEVDGLNQTIKNLNEQQMILKYRAEEPENKAANLRKENSRKEENVGRLTAELARMDCELHKMKSELAVIETVEKDAGKSIGLIRLEHDNVKQEVAKLKAKVDGREKELKEVRTLNENKRAEVEKVKQAKLYAEREKIEAERMEAKAKYFQTKLTIKKHGLSLKS